MMFRETNFSESFPSTALLLIGIISTQFSAVLAKQLFDVVGNLGTTSISFIWAAILLNLWHRPNLDTYNTSAKILLIIKGLVLAGMYLCLYGAIEKIPLGIAIAIQFIGPLGLSAAKTCHRKDLVWVFLAAVGVTLLSPFGQSNLEPFGVLLALLSGLLFGIYIVLAKKVGNSFSEGESLALAISVSAMVLLPTGINACLQLLISPALLLLSFGVAIFSAIVPLTIDLMILKQTSEKSFGVLLSLEPAIAALLGYVVLNEHLSWTVIAGIILIMISATGQSQLAREC